MSFHEVDACTDCPFSAKRETDDGPRWDCEHPVDHPDRVDVLPRDLAREDLSDSAPAECPLRMVGTFVRLRGSKVGGFSW